MCLIQKKEKKNEIITLSGKLKNLEIITLSEISTKKKKKKIPHAFALMWDLSVSQHIVQRTTIREEKTFQGEPVEEAVIEQRRHLKAEREKQGKEKKQQEEDLEIGREWGINWRMELGVELGWPASKVCQKLPQWTLSFVFQFQKSIKKEINQKEVNQKLYLSTLTMIILYLKCVRK